MNKIQEQLKKTIQNKTKAEEKIKTKETTRKEKKTIQNKTEAEEKIKTK